MSNSRYDSLIARIHAHCQTIIHDVLRFCPDAFEHLEGIPTTGVNPLYQDDIVYAGTVERIEDTLHWYIEARHYLYIETRSSFLALRKDFPDQVPTFAFPPATDQQIWETEQQLGFPLPPLLRLLYTQLANGGFGSGFGLLGAVGGYCGDAGAESASHIARRYNHDVNFANARDQLYRGNRAVWTQEMLQALEAEGIDISSKVWNGEFSSGKKQDEEAVSKETPKWEGRIVPPWPSHLLEICEWGCGISTYLHAGTEQVFQELTTRLVADSLDEWLERWLAGENLPFL